MTEFNKYLFEKYLNGTASAEEAERVLNWLQTDEGQMHLYNQIDLDISNIESIKNQFTNSADAHKTFRKIKSGVKPEKNRRGKKRRSNKQQFVWIMAASIAFLVATISLIVNHYGFDESLPAENVPIIVYSTESDEQKNLRLSDGSVIRISENSRIEIPEYFSTNQRSVNLQGQAFFEVMSDSSKPFVVHTNNIEIRVLGTAFNVKTNPHSGDMLVAVEQGRVSMELSDGSIDKYEILERNMIGYFDLRNNNIIKENSDIYNYLSWIHGRIVFDRTPFPDVVKQLERIYNLNCEILNEELNELRLTANFEAKSVENVLEVIGHALEIDYEKKGDAVIWRMKRIN